MNEQIVKRVLDETFYILNTKNTIRQIAKVFVVSKSTVHKDLDERLQIIDNKLHKEVRKILNYHTNIRHIRGGESTRKKYLELKGKLYS